MKKTLIVAILGICFLPVWVNGALNWNVYSDAVIVDGDEYANVSVYDTPPDHTTLDMSGGLVDTLGSTNESVVNISGGTVYTLNITASSTANVSGGYVYTSTAIHTGKIYVKDNADIYNLFARDTAEVEVFDGSVEQITAMESGTFNLRGGEIADSITATDNSFVNVFGTSLFKTYSGGAKGYGYVSGIWTDGSSFSIPFWLSDTHSRVILHEIPEPSIALLLSFGLLQLRRHS